MTDIQQQVPPNSKNTQNKQPAPANEREVNALRQITGAPDINVSLVSQDAFADVAPSSERPIWKLPLPKLSLVALALVPMVGLAGYFLRNNNNPQPLSVASQPADSEEETQPNQEGTTKLENAEQEISKLKTQMALADQAYVQQRKPLTPEPVTTNSEKPKADSATPAAAAVSARTSPPSISQRPAPPTIQSSPAPFSRVTEVNLSESPAQLSTETVDPFDQWRQLAQLGSYGGLSQSEIVEALPSEALGPDAAITEAVPAAYFSTISRRPVTTRDLIFREDSETQPSSEPEITTSPEPNEVEQPRSSVLDSATDTEEQPILAEAEARILEAQRFDEPFQTRSLMAGSHVPGELLTPVILDSEGVEDRFVIVLNESLLDNASKTAIPEGALLMVQVNRASAEGAVQLSATQAVWEEQGFQQELMLPSYTFLIRGENGDPLMAESYGDSGGDIAAMDMGQFALGAIRRIGELYTRSDSRVQTGDGTTIITEDNPSPNILAGALEGGSDAILDTISERNQRAIETLEQRPRIPYLPAGKPVQIFINRTMQMPADF